STGSNGASVRTECKAVDLLRNTAQTQAVFACHRVEQAHAATDENAQRASVGCESQIFRVRNLVSRKLEVRAANAPFAGGNIPDFQSTFTRVILSPERADTSVGIERSQVGIALELEIIDLKPPGLADSSLRCRQHGSGSDGGGHDEANDQQ